MTTKILETLKYTKEHEWAQIENEGIITCGITDYAQSSLGDIVFIELPEKGTTVEKNISCGVIESIKSVSDLYAPVSGVIIETNEEIVENPEMCNAGPYNAWLFKIKTSNETELESLLSAEQYQAHCDSAS